MAKLRLRILPSTATYNSKTKNTTMANTNAVPSGRVTKIRCGVNKNTTVQTNLNATQLHEIVDNNVKSVFAQKNRKCVVRLKRISEKPKKQHQNSVILSDNTERLTNVASSTNLCDTSLRGAEHFSPTIQTQKDKIESTKTRKLTVRLMKITPQSRKEIFNNVKENEDSANSSKFNGRFKKAKPPARGNILNVKEKEAISKSKNCLLNIDNGEEYEYLQNAPAKTVTTRSNIDYKIYSSKNREMTAGSRRKKKSSITSNVYKFLTQSQNDSDFEERVDPAADIVRKKIENGTVLTTKFVKARGKSRAKHKKVKKIRPVGRRRQCSLDDVADAVLSKGSVAAKCKPTRPPPPNLSPVYESEYDYDNDKEIDEHAQEQHNQLDIFEQEVPNPLGISFEEKDQAPKQIESNINASKNSESGFINLARAVLINQTKRQNPTLAHQQRLLEVARKFVSTPVNKKKNLTETHNITNLSPIAAPAQPTKATGCPSPWRVSDELVLPKTFIFGRDNSNLPSFSSDFIPRTPRKSNKNVLSTTVNRNEKQPGHITSTERLNESLLRSNNQSAISSPYNANNSNGENVAPIGDLTTNNSNTFSNQTPSKHSINENHDKENFVHLPNPRRTLQNRSPFKPIQILDVIHLPSWRTNNKFVSKSKSNDIVAQAPNTISPVKDKLFGFEDFLDNSQLQENLPTSSGSSDNCPKKVCNDSTLHNNLKELREIRPVDEELPQPTKIPIRYIFDGADVRNQRKIKEMLCSTMVQNETLKNKFNDADESQILFDDPETTFDDKAPLVTYIRPSKRKRKQRHNFVTFMDSDISEEEDDEEPHPKNKYTNKNKRNRKEEIELHKFETTFNKMCEEVNQYELQVE